MGADFLFDILPLAEETPQRRQILLDMVNAISEENRIYLCNECFYCDDIDFESLLDTYWALQYQRDVGTFLFPNLPRYMVSGGMSWGDTPTDAMEVMNKIMYLDDICGIYDVLLKWAWEDRVSGIRFFSFFKDFLKHMSTIFSIRTVKLASSVWLNIKNWRLNHGRQADHG